jgi:hypothetical protein
VWPLAHSGSLCVFISLCMPPLPPNPCSRTSHLRTWPGCVQQQVWVGEGAAVRRRSVRNGVLKEPAGAACSVCLCLHVPQALCSSVPLYCLCVEWLGAGCVPPSTGC